MRIQEIQGITVQGVTVRTCNADEAHPDRARIGRLWSEFGAQVVVRMASQAQVYGVYHRYESDASGMFDVLAGTDALQPLLQKAAELSSVTIEPGQYLVFEATGATPQAVMDTWQRIWRYFADPACPHVRAYTTDFERYPTQAAVEIFIALVSP